MARSPHRRPGTAKPPSHAQPGGLAALRWTSALEWAAVVIVLLLGAALSVDGSGVGRPVAAAAVEPPSIAAVSPGGQSGTQSSSVPSSAAPDPASARPSSTAGQSSNSTQRDSAAASALAADGIPITALLAYQHAATRANALDPACQLPWPLLAAIGRVESDHGRFAGAVLHTDGLSTPRVIGIPLDGHGTAVIRDTDNGRLDGDSVYDRAVGPMQFIPSTWARYAADGNADGVADPFNIYDAAAAAADYLCRAGGDLSTTSGQTRAVLAYNHSSAYVHEVLELEQVYAAGVMTVPVPAPSSTPLPAIPSGIPPVNPAPPTSIAPPPTAHTSTAGTKSGTRGGASAPASGTGGTSTTPGTGSTSGCPASTSSTPPCSATPTSSTPPCSATPTSPTPTTSGTGTSTSTGPSTSATDCPRSTPSTPPATSSTPPNSASTTDSSAPGSAG